MGIFRALSLFLQLQVNVLLGSTAFLLLFSAYIILQAMVDALSMKEPETKREEYKKYMGQYLKR
jgi:hypothetical protein